MSTQTIDTFLTWLKFNSDTTGVDKAEESLKGLEERTKKVNEVMETFKRTLEFVGAAFAIDKIVELNNEYDLAQNKLKSVGVEGANLAQVTQEILDISNATGTSLEANTELYQQLSVSLGDAANSAEKLKVMDTLSKIFAISGTETSQSKRAIQDMSKALEGPTVRYQEIKQAMNDIPALQALISKHFKDVGTTWQDALQGNNFATNEFVKVLVTANKTVTDQFNLTARTIPQAFTALTNSLSVFIGKLGVSSNFVSDFTDMLGSLANKANNASDWVSKNSAIIKSFASAIGVFLEILAVRFGIMAAIAVTSMLPMILAISSLVLVMQDLIVFIDGGSSVIGRFLLWLGLSSDQIKEVKNDLHIFIEKIKEMIKYILTSKTAIIALSSVLGVLATEWAIGKVLSFSSGIGGVVVSVYELIKGMKLLTIGMKAFNIVAAITDLLLDPFILLIELIIVGIAGLIYILYKFGGTIIKVIEEYLIKKFNKAKNFLKLFVNFVKYIFKSILADIEAPFKKLESYWTSLSSKFGWLGKKIKSTLGFGDTKVKHSTSVSNNPLYINPMQSIFNMSSPLMSSPGMGLNSGQQTHNNTFQITVNAKTNASASDIAKQTAIQTNTLVSQHYRNAALNHDSIIKR